MVNFPPQNVIKVMEGFHLEHALMKIKEISRQREGLPPVGECAKRRHVSE